MRILIQTSRKEKKYETFQLFSNRGALVVLFGSPLAFSQEEIRIGYIVPLTGAVARDGSSPCPAQRWLLLRSMQPEGPGASASSCT